MFSHFHPLLNASSFQSRAEEGNGYQPSCTYVQSFPSITTMCSPVLTCRAVHGPDSRPAGGHHSESLTDKETRMEGWRLPSTE